MDWNELLATTAKVLSVPPYSWGWTAGLGALAAVLLVGLFRRRPSRVLVFQGEGGTVSVTVHALNDLVRRVCLENEGVGRASATLRGPPGRFALEVRVQLLAPATLPTLAPALQERLRDRLRAVLGLQGLARVDIVATEVKFPCGAATAEESPGPAEHESPAAANSKPAIAAETDEFAAFADGPKGASVTYSPLPQPRR